MNFKNVELKVIQWGIDRDLYKESSPVQQMEKLFEEYQELQAALICNDGDEICDAIGDMIVVLTHIAHFNGVDLTLCYKGAYNEIKDRKGKIVNGIFVKESK